MYQTRQSAAAVDGSSAGSSAIESEGIDEQQYSFNLCIASDSVVWTVTISMGSGYRKSPESD